MGSEEKEKKGVIKEKRLKIKVIRKGEKNQKGNWEKKERK